MNKLILLAGAAMFAATPAMAVDIIGGSTTSSASNAAVSSTGGSASLIYGTTTQQSSAGANSNGYGINLMPGDGSNSSLSNHTSVTAQQGSSASLGLAGSGNANVAGAHGASSASGGLLTGFLVFGG